MRAGNGCSQCDGLDGLADKQLGAGGGGLALCPHGPEHGDCLFAIQRRPVVSGRVGSRALAANDSADRNHAGDDHQHTDILPILQQREPRHRATVDCLPTAIRFVSHWSDVADDRRPVYLVGNVVFGAP